MNSDLNLAGKLKIAVGHRNGVIKQVNIQSSRPTQLSKILIGKTPEQVVEEVPLLFSLCNCAQTIACLTALETALGYQVDSDTLYARKILLLVETAKEIGIRLGQDWLQTDDVLHLPALLQWFLDIRASLQWALQLQAQPADQVYSPTRFVLELESIIKGVIGPDESQFRQAVYGQCRLHPVGRVLAQLNAKFQRTYLCSPCPEMAVDSDYIEEQLIANGEVFSALPQADSGCCETSVWTRNRTKTIITESQALSMSPIALRFLAQILELKRIAPRMLQAHKQLLIFSDRAGFAKVEAARGALIHRAVLDSKATTAIINQYQIVAPTEWNFHPQGTLVQMLQGVAVAKDGVVDLVSQLVLAVDPCVAYEVEVN